ncbi:hypothetical protein [Ruegeria lacuscaerulensis]|uniref:hypothetical protein n=1 Tax=Ruegeria lacuscaerulensis TaxID=55218 RepID=UPI00147CAA71|nr:hypothetical protein [Ruegeria lacuscaerulensis]
MNGIHLRPEEIAYGWAAWREQMVLQLEDDDAPEYIKRTVREWFFEEYEKATLRGMEMPCPDFFDIRWTGNDGLITQHEDTPMADILASTLRTKLQANVIQIEKFIDRWQL